MKSIQLLSRSLLGLGSLLLLSGCGNWGDRAATSKQTVFGTSQEAIATPVQFERKSVNDGGGYFCSDGRTALGPFTEKMVQKCLDWGGGSACRSDRWSEDLFLNAYGTGRCPDGARFNRIASYCVEGKNALGPFPETLIAACQKRGGGTSCHSNRWNSQFLFGLMRDEGLIDLPEGRPPQFVLLAFDGSRSLDAWNKSRNFAKEMEAKGIPLRFTYFISAVYFINDGDRQLYDAPAGKGVGRSAIGWGGTTEEVKQRLDQLNFAYQEGHEIASHAVGHFDGSRWSEADWTKEFDAFDRLIFDSYKINNLDGSLAFDRAAIEGFRAPELGRGSGLYKTLQKKGFRYDTSQVAQADYWPQKQNGVWNFPLASLRTAKSGKNVLSMDYNFYYAHSKARPNSANAKFYEEDTYQTYMNYFKANDEGNRAPVHIGHHFSAWNNGAYWNAMFRFAESVCGQPEVRCITYGELADFMDLLTPEQIAAYQKGEFPKRSAEAEANPQAVSPFEEPQRESANFCQI
ncbi:hypothetical protein [Lyngbya sp. CCY1209]|uniref:hypothetical protein n=1 Tax=Lyngbya sp. CCY1209 TaxID=2886103 RepID=UPI002D200665|nr:hypothetical protein [Lyngbya sp. CCY1209]MEB3885297.1 hypothetical protein [Lyngbya sp. CCY1209]